MKNKSFNARISPALKQWTQEAKKASGASSDAKLLLVLAQKNGYKITPHDL